MSIGGLDRPQIEQFRKEGYLVLPSFLEREVIDRVDATVREMAMAAMDSDDPSSVLELEPDLLDGNPVVRRIYDPYDQHKTFRELANTPRLVDTIESLIGPDINLQHSKLNMKPPQVGSVVEWHQDLTYFPHTNDDLVTTLIYLDDATEENGCLRVLPRHHCHFFDHHTPDGYFAGMITEDIESGEFGTPASLAGPAGSVILMHCILPHSSLPNRSSRPRRTLIFEYRASDAFPIQWASKATARDQAYRPIRGEPAQFARFGGPPPYVPKVQQRFASLYELQTRAKAKIAEPAAQPSR